MIYQGLQDPRTFQPGRSSRLAWMLIFATASVLTYPDDPRHGQPHAG